MNSPISNTSEKKRHGASLFATQSDKKRRVLHLIGSKKNEFYYDLSLVYAIACDSCQDIDREKFEFFYA